MRDNLMAAVCDHVFFPTESFKGSTVKRPFKSSLVELVDKEKGVDGKRASGLELESLQRVVRASSSSVCLRNGYRLE